MWRCRNGSSAGEISWLCAGLPAWASRSMSLARMVWEGDRR